MKLRVGLRGELEDYAAPVRAAGGGGAVEFAVGAEGGVGDGFGAVLPREGMQQGVLPRPVPLRRQLEDRALVVSPADSTYAVQVSGSVQNHAFGITAVLPPGEVVENGLVPGLARARSREDGAELVDHPRYVFTS